MTDLNADTVWANPFQFDPNYYFSVETLRLFPYAAPYLRTAVATDWQGFTLSQLGVNQADAVVRHAYQLARDANPALPVTDQHWNGTAWVDETAKWSIPHFISAAQGAFEKYGTGDVARQLQAIGAQAEMQAYPATAQLASTEANLAAGNSPTTTAAPSRFGLTVALLGLAAAAAVIFGRR